MQISECKKTYPRAEDEADQTHHQTDSCHDYDLTFLPRLFQFVVDGRDQRFQSDKLKHEIEENGCLPNGMTAGGRRRQGTER